MWKNIVERSRPQWQYGACALHAGYLRLQILTLRLCNTHCFPIATMDARALLSITLYVHCLSCYICHSVVSDNKWNKLPSAQLVSVIPSIWQHVSTPDGHLQASSIKYIKGSVDSCIQMLAISFIHNIQNSFNIFCTTGLRLTVWGPNMLPNWRYNNKTNRVYGNKFLSLFSQKVCLRGLRRGSAVARLLGLRTRIRPGTWIFFWGGGGVVFVQVEVSASGWSLVQRSSTECGVSECDREASWGPGQWRAVASQKKITKETRTLTINAKNPTCLSWEIKLSVGLTYVLKCFTN